MLLTIKVSLTPILTYVGNENKNPIWICDLKLNHLILYPNLTKKIHLTSISVVNRYQYALMINSM